jgi:diaphanous 1
MYNLPADRKRYLLKQNKEVRAATVSRASGAKSEHASQTPYSASYGPASAAAFIPRIVPQITGDNGLMKRFSMASWGSGSITNPSPPQTPTQSQTTLMRSDTGESPSVSPRVSEESKSVRSQSTGGMWSNWWTSSGGDSNTEKSKTPLWYVDGILNARLVDMKLVKHLISLRVHLSTAQLIWIEEFVCNIKGIDALGTLLSNLVGKGGKRKKLSDTEESVLLEVIKCLRVLLNTEVRRILRSFSG